MIYVFFFPRPVVDLVAGLPWVRCCCVVDLVAGRCAAATLAFFASSSLFLRFASSTLAALSLFCTSFLAAASAAVSLFFVPSFFFAPAGLRFLGADAARFRVEIGVFFVDGRPRGRIIIIPVQLWFCSFSPTSSRSRCCYCPPWWRGLGSDSLSSIWDKSGRVFLSLGRSIRSRFLQP